MTDVSFFSEDKINIYMMMSNIKWQKHQIKGDFYKENIFKYTNNKNDKMRQFIYTYTYKKQNIKYYYTQHIEKQKEWLKV